MIGTALLVHSASYALGDDLGPDVITPADNRALAAREREELAYIEEAMRSHSMSRPHRHTIEERAQELAVHGRDGTPRRHRSR
jgi:hypothetical protein